MVIRKFTIPVTVPLQSTNQRRLVLSPSAHTCTTGSNSVNSIGSNQQFPIVMPFNGNNAPVFVYQNAETLSNNSVPNKLVDNTNSAANAVGQMVLTPVSPVQNPINVHQSGSSSTVPANSVHSDSNSNASRSLGEIFNMQNIGSIQTTGSMMALNPNVMQQNMLGNGELAGILTSLQAAGLHIVDQGNSKCK